MLSRKSVWTAILALVFVLFFALSVLAEKPDQPDQTTHTVNVSANSCTGPDGLPGYVDFSVWSWNFDSDAGLHDDIKVSYQVETDQNIVSSYVEYMRGKFTNANRRQFSGTLEGVPANVNRVTVMVEAVGDWKNGDKGGQMNDVTVFPHDCDGVTVSPIEGEPLNNHIFLPNVQRSMIPWLLLVAPVVLLGARKDEGKVKCTCGSENVLTTTSNGAKQHECQSCSKVWIVW